MVLLLALLRFRHKNHLARLKHCGFVLIDVLVATKTSGNVRRCPHRYLLVRIDLRFRPTSSS